MATSVDDTMEARVHESGRNVHSDLQFQDIPHTASDAMKDNEQTHTFTNFPETHEEVEDDKSELLEKEEKQPVTSFWTFEYYQQFFDVDTVQVGKRILGSMMPNPKANFLQAHIRPNPDLYGPFWICTTLVFTTAIAGNLANYIQQAGQDYNWKYDFHKVTFAATAIYSYWWLLPAMIWAVLKWRKSEAGITFLEILCIYGYSLAVYIPISILWVIQYNWLQWLLVILGMCLSGTVLVITFWPAVRNDEKKVAIALMVIIVLFHGLLAVSFMLYFFHVPNTSSGGGSGALNSTTTVTQTVTTTLSSTKLAPTKQS